MKKLIYFIVMFISVCIFTISFDRFNEQLFYHYSEMYVPRSDNHEIINVNYSAVDDSIKMEDVVSEVRAYAKEHQLDISFSGTETYLGRKYTYRWVDLNSGAIPFDSVYIKERTTNSISNNHPLYYTTNPEDTLGLHLMYLDSSYYDSQDKNVLYYVSIDEMSDLWKTRSSLGFMINVPQEDVDTHLHLIEQCFSNFAEGIQVVDKSMLYSPTESKDDSLKMITVLGVVFLIILLLLYTLKQSKEIKIRMMYGNKDHHIYYHIYAKLVFYMSVLSAIMFIVLYLVKVQEVHMLGLQFLMPLLGLSLLSFGLFHLISFLFYFMMKQCMKARMAIKLPFRTLYYISGIVRIALIVLTMTQVISTLTNIKMDISMYQKLQSNQSYYADKIQLGRLGNMHLSTFTEENFEVYRRFTKKGAVYCDSTPLYNDYHELTVNDSYVKCFLNKTFVTSLVKEKNMDIIFKHISDKDKPTFSLLNESDALVVYYEDDIIVPVLGYHDYSLETNLKNPVLVVVRDLSRASSSGSLNGPEFMIPVENPDGENTVNEIVEVILDLRLSEGLTIEPVHVIVESQRKYFINEALRAMMEFVLYVAVMIAFAILNLRLYYLEYGKEVMIRLLHGNPYLTRYGAVLFAELLVYGVSAVSYYLLYQSNDAWILMIVIFILDIMLYQFMIGYYERTNFVAMLKGEQL